MQIVGSDAALLPWAVVGKDGAVLGRLLSMQLAELAAAAFARAPLTLIAALLQA